MVPVSIRGPWTTLKQCCLVFIFSYCSMHSFELERVARACGVRNLRHAAAQGLGVLSLKLEVRQSDFIEET